MPDTRPPDIDILWGFDQVKWRQMGPNEGCHLVCSPMGWEARGGREDEDDDYEHGTERHCSAMLQHQGTRERERGLTPLVLIKRVSSEWAAADAARDQRKENQQCRHPNPMLEGRRRSLNVPTWWFNV